MSTSRRHFLQYSLTAASMLALAPEAFAGSDKKPQATAKKKLKILVLGGTGFLGPGLRERGAGPRPHADALQPREDAARSCSPTWRSCTETGIRKKGEGLKALEGRKWDAVLDTSGYYPRMVGASAQLLAAPT